MTETHNVFISWSGDRSKRAAEFLKEWLQTVIQRAQPWMSATSMEKRTRWREEVSTALDTMKAGVICLTPENLLEPWILFEAGALSKTLDAKTRVWTYLLSDLETRNLKDPLSIFNATKANKTETLELVQSINATLDGKPVPEASLNKSFEKFWPELEAELKAIKAMPGAVPKKLSTDKMLEEMHAMLQEVTPVVFDVSAETAETRKRRLAEEAWSKAIASLPKGNVIVSGSPSVPGVTGVAYPISPPLQSPVFAPLPAGLISPGFTAGVDTTPHTALAESMKDVLTGIGPSTPHNDPEPSPALPSSPRRKARAPRPKRKPDPNSKR